MADPPTRLSDAFLSESDLRKGGYSFIVQSAKADGVPGYTEKFLALNGKHVRTVAQGPNVRRILPIAWPRKSPIIVFGTTPNCSVRLPHGYSITKADLGCADFAKSRTSQVESNPDEVVSKANGTSPTPSSADTDPIRASLQAVKQSSERAVYFALIQDPTENSLILQNKSKSILLASEASHGTRDLKPNQVKYLQPGRWTINIDQYTFELQILSDIAFQQASVPPRTNDPARASRPLYSSLTTEEAACDHHSAVEVLMYALKGTKISLPATAAFPSYEIETRGATETSGNVCISPVTISGVQKPLIMTIQRFAASSKPQIEVVARSAVQYLLNVEILENLHGLLSCGIPELASYDARLRLICFSRPEGKRLASTTYMRKSGPARFHTKLTIAEGITVGHDISRMVAILHRRNVVHQNLCPQNIIIGRGRIVTFADLCSASIKGKNNPNLDEGDPYFAAPEWLEGQARDYKGDVFALGLLCVFLIGWIPLPNLVMTRYKHQNYTLAEVHEEWKQWMWYRDGTAGLWDVPKDRPAMMAMNSWTKDIQDYRVFLLEADNEYTKLFAEMLSLDPADRPRMEQVSDRFRQLAQSMAGLPPPRML